MYKKIDEFVGLYHYNHNIFVYFWQVEEQSINKIFTLKKTEEEEKRLRGPSVFFVRCFPSCL